MSMLRPARSPPISPRTSSFSTRVILGAVDLNRVKNRAPQCLPRPSHLPPLPHKDCFLSDEEDEEDEQDAGEDERSDRDDYPLLISLKDALARLKQQQPGTAANANSPSPAAHAGSSSPATNFDAVSSAPYAWAEEDESLILFHDPPPPAVFYNREDMKDYLQAYMEEQGACLVTKRSDSKEGRLRLQCVKGSQPRRTEMGGRDRASHKDGCPFEISCKDGNRDRKRADLSEACRWGFEVEKDCEEHNHPPLTTSTIAYMRRMEPEQREELRKHLSRGLRTKDCMRVMSETYPKLRLIARDIWFERYGHRLRERGGHSAVEAAVIKMREEPGNLFRVFRAEDGTVLGIMYTTPEVC